jgi:hypothetical protein
VLEQLRAEDGSRLLGNVEIEDGALGDLISPD